MAARDTDHWNCTSALRRDSASGEESLSLILHCAARACRAAQGEVRACGGGQGRRRGPCVSGHAPLAYKEQRAKDAKSRLAVCLTSPTWPPGCAWNKRSRAGRQHTEHCRHRGTRDAPAGRNRAIGGQITRAVAVPRTDKVSPARSSIRAVELSRARQRARAPRGSGRAV